MAEESVNIQQARPCPKNCQMCSMAQQLYCATNLSFTSYEVMSKIVERLNVIEASINEMKMSGNEFINPITQESENSGNIPSKLKE